MDSLRALAPSPPGAIPLLVVAVLAALAIAPGPAPAIDEPGSVGPGHGVLVTGPTRICDSYPYVENWDRTPENGYCWSYRGSVPPYYGAFAEGFGAFPCVVCGMRLWLTQIGGQGDRTLDAYVWDWAAGDNPGEVLAVVTGVQPGPIAYWPNVSAHDVEVGAKPVPDCRAFVGYWGNWPGRECAWYVAADTNGSGGLPRTCLAPGLGYPTGWQDPSIVWGPTASLGIGIYAFYDTPVQETTWGAVKSLYR